MLSPLFLILAAVYLLAAIVACYFIPSFVARARGHHNAVSIFLLNLFLGWTLVGWVAALVWAMSSPPPMPSPMVVVNTAGALPSPAINAAPLPSPPRELSDATFCSHCGKRREGTLRFCRHCSASFD